MKLLGRKFSRLIYLISVLIVVAGLIRETQEGDEKYSKLTQRLTKIGVINEL